MDGRSGVRYVMTKFSRIDSLPNFLPMVLNRARALRYKTEDISKGHFETA